MVGILRCGKMLNLVIEIEFADATTALWSGNAGAHPAGAAVRVLSKAMAVLSSFINDGRFIKVEDQASGRNDQIFRFRLRMADFILPRTSSLSTAKSSHF